MDNLAVILFICIVVPLALLLFLLDKKSRLVVFFMIIGCFICLFVSSVNSILLVLSGKDLLYVVTTITPISEEILKAFPILLFAFSISDDRRTLISISMAVGIGFAIMENTMIMVSNVESTTVLWALVRGFGSRLMHGLCTSMVGCGISAVRQRKKLFYTGTFALLSAAITFHAIYNCLVGSSLMYAGILLPMAVYVPVLIAVAKHNKKFM